MGRIQEIIVRRDQVAAAIHILLENQGIDTGTDWDIDPDNLKRLNTLADGSMDCIVYSGDLGITQREDETKLIFAVASGDSDFFQQQLPVEVIKALEEPGTKTVQLVFLVRNMQSRIFLETKFDAMGIKDLREIIRDKAYKAGATIKKKYKLPINYVLLQEYTTQDVRLTNLHPIEMLHQPPINRSINIETKMESISSIQARVFTVDLYQLVQKYNLIGDILFQNNVRFGINETLGVEQSMRETLASEPENFWFKNNGVTFLIRNSRTFLQENKTVLLGRIDSNEELSFSVVNGAQTIITAARYFFELEAKRSKEDAKEEFDTAKQKAHVLVRVINVMDTDDIKAVATSRAISVALNRQKPIRTDDIAFTHPAVWKLAEYLRKTKDAPFVLIRQGESTTNVTIGMDLISFARARMACAGRPGAARTIGRDKLLELKADKDGSTRFVQEELFSPDWLDAEDEKEERIFRQYYGAIPFAHQLAKLYETQMRKFQSDDAEIQNTIKNGKWYFTAIITQIVNAFKSDYSEFSGSLPESLPQLMDAFARRIVSEIGVMGNIREVNSNLFKTEKLYDNIIMGLEAKFLFASLSGPVSDSQILQLISPKSPFYPTYENVSISTNGNYVILDGQRIDVTTDAKALVEVVKHILINYPVAVQELREKFVWITDDINNRPRGSHSILINGKLYYVDAHSNWEEKHRRMMRVCETANVKHGTVKWHKTGDTKFTFSW